MRARPAVPPIARARYRASFIAIPTGCNRRWRQPAPLDAFPKGPSMINPFEDEQGEFLVLVNDEGQYSLWPTFRQVPAGWSAVGPRGPRRECLDWIDATWTDMRPASLSRS